MNLRRKAEAALWGLALVLWCAPAVAGAAEWEQYLADDFVSAETMFYTGPAGSAFYSIDDGGQYVIDGLSSSVDSLSALTDNLYYYYVEGQCSVSESTAGELAFAGLVFHYNKRVKPGAYAYYVFYIYADGYYGAKRVIGESVEIVLPLTRSDMIDQNLPNVLAVDAQGTRFDLYINGRYVDGFTDVRIDGGGFGFYISKNTKAIFDNFVVKVERRETGKEEGGQPEPGGANSADSSFEGYQFPNIPRDPDRPVYPWEVGVDKSGKEPKPPADDEGVEGPVEDETESGEEQPEGAAPPGFVPDQAEPGESDLDAHHGQSGAEPSVPPGEELVPPAPPTGVTPPPDRGAPPARPPDDPTITDTGDASAVILVPASELIQQEDNDGVDVDPAMPETPAAEAAPAEGAAAPADAGAVEPGAGQDLPPIEEILGNLQEPDEEDKSASGADTPAETAAAGDETYIAPQDEGDLSLYPEEQTGGVVADPAPDEAPPLDNGGLISAEPTAVAGSGGEPAPETPGVTMIADDFTARNWPESQDDVSNYSYFGGAYQIDNLRAETMAISFKKGDFSDAELAVDAEFLDGRANVGFGLAARFRVEGGSVSYYGLFIAGSGEYLLLKVVNGGETVLKDWTTASLISPDSPNTIKLELVGSTIKAFINGELVTTLKDSDIRSGGYALLAGPGLAARYDNFSLRGVTAEAQ